MKLLIIQFMNHNIKKGNYRNKFMKLKHEKSIELNKGIGGHESLIR